MEEGRARSVVVGSVAFLCITYVGLALLGVMFSMFGGKSFIPIFLTPLVIALIVSFFLLRYKNWARWAAFVLLLISSLLILWGVLSSSGAIIPRGLMLLFSIIGLSNCYMLMNPDVKKLFQ